MPNKPNAKKKQPKKLLRMVVPKKHLLDKHADSLASSIKGTDDEVLTTRETAAVLKVSRQWLEIGRHKGYGPEFQRVGPHSIRYERGKIRKYLAERTHQSTSEYAK